MSLDEIDMDALLGTDAAEDETPERLRGYFLKTSTWRAVTESSRRLRILVGNKGTGKSAIFLVAAQDDELAGRLPIVVRPDQLLGIAEGDDDHLQLVRAWAAGLGDVIVREALKSFGAGDDSVWGAAKGTAGRILDTITQMLGETQKGFQVAPARRRLAEAFLKTREMVIYVDDLDRGWVGRRSDVKRLAAMFDAVRDLLRDNPGLKVRIALRTDVYSLIRTEDAS